MEMNSLEIAQDIVKKMLQCEREYRCEVSDPQLRFEKLVAIWEYSHFMTERADPVELARVVREMIQYQIFQIRNLIVAQQGTMSYDSGVYDQQLKVLNAIFEYVCRLARSAQYAIKKHEDLDSFYDELIKGRVTPENSPDRAWWTVNRHGVCHACGHVSKEEPDNASKEQAVV